MKQVSHDLWQEPEDLEVIITHDHPVDLEQATTIVNVTADGIIINFYTDGEMTGSVGMTYDAWFDFSQEVGSP